MFRLIKRYDKPLSYHDIKIINDILYNEKTHYVEAFKEYLIYEDYNEFLKRFYKTSDLSVKLPKILIFYEKYSKIYANYTVIPESKYMYKNIKRKQKMIDQMQNNGNNESEFEEDEESKEEMSNTVFSSKIMNSLYRKTLTTLNKSDNGNSEQSINDFVSKINNIENKVNNNCLKNNFIKNTNKYVKSQKEMLLPMKKLQKEFLTHKYTPKSTKLNNFNKNEQNFNNKYNNQKNKFINIQFTYSKKNLQRELFTKNKTNNNINSNINPNLNTNTNSNGNILNKNNNNMSNPNLIFINSYVHKNNNSNNIFNNNNSYGNTNNSNSNNSNTFHGTKNSINAYSSSKTNTNTKVNISKQKLPTALLKQSVINSNVNNINNNCKDNMSVTNINNYFTNATNNLKNSQKYKLSLGETLLKCDKIVLSTNSSCSPNIINDKLFSSPSSKNNNNIFNGKNQIIKDKEKGKNKDYIIQPLTSNKMINNKKIKSHLLGSDYNSMGNNLTFLSNKFIESQKFKNMSKLNKKKINKKLIDIQNKNINPNYNDYNGNDNYVSSEAQSNINFKKPESHRNYCHSKILSGNNSNTKNKINNNNNSNKNFKITVGLKHDLKHNSQKVISSPVSPSSSGSNFYFHSNLQTHKDSSNNLDTNMKKTLEEYNKKKVVHNYNIVNNIHDNSTQINIYTGNELYKSLHFHNNSVFNSSNMIPANTYSKSPVGIGAEGVGNKNKKNSGGQPISHNANNSFFKSNIKGKEKQNKYNLNLKKIIHKRILEGDKAIISERQMTRRKLIEKLGKYFFKNKNENTNNNTNNINYNNHINNNTNSNNYYNNKQNNNNKHNGNKHNILYNNNNYTKHINHDYSRLINKIINKSNSNSSKVLKHKTNNNTPNKNKINPYIIKNHRKMHNICLSPQYNDEMKKMNKVSSRQNINYNNIISNLNDLKNIGVDDGNKLLIHSERNKNNKIVFK